MAAPRFYSSAPLARDATGMLVELPESVAHHAARVLRLAMGDALTLFDGAGGEFEARLERIDKRGAAARVLRFVATERESTLDMTLAQAIAANEAMDVVVRKATELGVTSIQPLMTARSSPLPPGERADKRLAHWQHVAIAACEQCGRNRVPEVAPPVAIAEWMRGWTGGGVLFDPGAAQSVATVARPASPLALLIGPEGGFDAREVAAAQAKGFATLALGPRVLRADTATIACVALVQAFWGDLR
jgi:16S rRNA (uracil1498-N3)-methyltransferase